MDVVIAYDIATTTRAGQRRLTKISGVCERYGVRVQYSLFECRLSEARFVKLRAELEEVIDPRVDRVLLYRFEGSLQNAKVALGAAVSRDLSQPWIV